MGPRGCHGRAGADALGRVATVTREALRRLVPRPLRTAAKGMLRSVGLYDERAIRIGLRRVYEDDVFVVCYPKSGNTWVRFLLGHMLHPGKTLTFETLRRGVVPDIHRARAEIDRMARPRYIKSHFPAYTSYPRMVYIYRDGRDVMVSFFIRQSELGGFHGSFSEFIRSRRVRLFGAWPWHEHVAAALDHAEANPGRAHFIQHERAELHGFLAYLARAVKEGRTYRIYGYKGKQVRDNIHSYDVCTACLAFCEAPRVAAVYNLGGGRANSVSILEAIARFEDLIGKTLKVEYVEENRVGDHICYISNLQRLKTDYPRWEIIHPLDDIFRVLAASTPGEPA